MGLRLIKWPVRRKIQMPENVRLDENDTAESLVFHISDMYRCTDLRFFSIWRKQSLFDTYWISDDALAPANIIPERSLHSLTNRIQISHSNYSGDSSRTTRTCSHAVFLLASLDITRLDVQINLTCSWLQPSQNHHGQKSIKNKLRTRDS